MIGMVGKGQMLPIVHRNLLSQLINDTKKIFDLVKRRKGLLNRTGQSDELQALKEQHNQLTNEEDMLIERYPMIQHSEWGTLRSFFIRFRFRLAELVQLSGNMGCQSAASDYISGLDLLIQEILQKNPIDTGRFLQYVFGHYRKAITKKIQSLQPVGRVQEAKVITLSTIDPSLSPKMRSAPMRVLSCNDSLFNCWTKEGKRNYEPLGIDSTLKEVYFFSRSQEHNASLMYQQMMERNREAHMAIQQYDKQYKRHQSWSRILSYSSNRQVNRRNRKEFEFFKAKQKSKSRPLMVLPPNSKQQIKRNLNSTQMERTIFRIRPTPDRSTKLSEPSSNQCVDTMINFGRTPRRESRIPATICIQFRSIRSIPRS